MDAVNDAPASPSLLGRAAEIGRLRDAAAAARSGRAQRLLIAGEAGLGKTSLVRAALSGTGLAVGWGDTSEFGNAGFGPVRDLLRRWRRDHAAGFAALRAAHPVLDHLLPPPGATVPPAEGDDMVDALAAALRSLAADAPTALVFDDLHAADHASIATIARLVDADETLAMLVVCVFRSDELARAHPLRRLRLQWRRATPRAEVELSPLPADAASALLAGALGAPAAPGLAAELQALAGGVPLYLEELAAALRERGALRSGPAGLERTAGHALPLPESLRDAVLLRAAALAPGTQRLLERAAVLGPQIDLVALAAAADDADDVERLLEAGWLRDTEPGCAAFRHALLREVVYAQIPWTRRRQWHAEAALRLEATPAAPALVAEHWLAAHDAEHARAALVRAAQDACTLHAHEDAWRAWSRALDLWPENVDEPGRLDALARLGDCAQRARRTDEAARAWREAAERAQRAGDPLHEAAARQRLAVLMAMAGEPARSGDERALAAEALERAGQTAAAAAEWYAAALSSNLASQWQAVLARVARARALDAAVVPRATRLLVQSLHGRTLARTGRIDEGLAACRAALAEADASGESSTVGIAYQRLADCHEHAGDYAEARNIFFAGSQWCLARGERTQLEACKACALPVLAATGEWPLALQLADEILADPDAPPWAPLVAVQTSGHLLALRGEHAAARPRLLQAVHDTERIGLATAACLACATLAFSEAAQGRLRTACDHGHEALRRWAQGEERHHLSGALRLLLPVFAAAGDREGLHGAVQAAAAAARTLGHAESLAALAAADGEVHLAEGRLDDALRELRRADELLAAQPLPLSRAIGRRRLAEVLALRGEAAEAAVVLREAVDGLAALGALPLRREAAERLRALAPASLTATDTRAVHAGLTPRQLQVLAQVACGQSDKQIARVLNLSPRTVEMHVARLLAALQCRTRAEAVRRGGELGLIAG
jgi:DNA-binding CsgD family transcriptional regulator